MFSLRASKKSSMFRFDTYYLLNKSNKKAQPPSCQNKTPKASIHNKRYYAIQNTALATFLDWFSLARMLWKLRVKYSYKCQLANMSDIKIFFLLFYCLRIIKFKYSKMKRRGTYSLLDSRVSTPTNLTSHSTP